MPESINLRLKPQELDYIMQVLQQRPWVEVNGLIQNLVQQANTPEVPSEPDATR